MATFNYELRTGKENEAGEMPIWLRIYSRGRKVFHSTNINVLPGQWNKSQQRIRKNHPNSKELNAELIRDLHEAERVYLELRNDLRTEPEAEKIKELIEGHSKKRFFDYAEEHMASMQSRDKYWQFRVTRPAISKFKHFVRNPDIRFDQITPETLRKFEVHLETEHKNKTNTIYKNMASIRRLFIQAVKDHIIPMDANPFNYHKLKKEKVRKDKLQIEDIQAIEALDLLPNSTTWHVRNYFLFSFYCAGIRFSDICLMQWKHITERNGNLRLIYQMSKTGQPKNIKLLPQAKNILEKYALRNTDPDRRIFPILPDDIIFETKTAEQKKIDSKNTIVNNHLKEIAEAADITTNVSFHIARHSFADYARQRGMDLYEISKALGHSSLKITENYLKSFDEEKLDEAMDRVFRDE